MDQDPNNNSYRHAPLVHLVGDSETYVTGNNTSDPVNRACFGQHTFVRYKDTGVVGNPVVKIQMSPYARDIPAESWVLIATLNDATPYVAFSNVYFPSVRTVKDDGVEGNVKVVVASNSNLAN